MNTMRPVSLALLAMTCLLVVACGGPRDGAPSPTSSSESKIDGVRVPEWVADPSVGGYLGAVGITRPSLGGQAQAFTKAQGNGRDEIARIIAVKVQAALVSYFQEGGEIFQGDQGPVYQTMATEMSENTSRQLTNQMVKSSMRKAFWQHPETKELYVWMVINPEYEELINKQIKDTVRQQVVRRSNVAAELKTKEALERLDAAIDKEMERQSADM